LHDPLRVRLLPRSHLPAISLILCASLSACAVDSEEALCGAASLHLKDCFGEASSAPTCDEASARAVLAESCEEMAGSEVASGKADVHRIGIAFARYAWRQVARRYMRPRGLFISADLLERSLDDRPAPLLMHPGAEAALAAAPEVMAFVAALAEAPRSFADPPGVIELRSDFDLFAAFQTVLLDVDRTTEVHALRVRDGYDFRWQRLEADSIQRLLATLGANLAYLDQLAGAIVRYDIALDLR